MGKGGGGSADTSGLENATKEATQLQREIWEQTRADSQPWYQAGVGAVSKLSDLLGISGGSMQTRDQMYQEMLPQYTQTQTSGEGDLFKNALGQIVGADYDPMKDPAIANQVANLANQPGVRRGLTQLTPYSTSEDVTDVSALNAAVDARFSEQGVPDDYG
jgi:hypothetical protein